MKLFKVESVEIDGFWHRLKAKCEFNEDVNIIIGRNGTGKTTFMNILQSILTVDISGLSENDFNNASVILVSGKKRKTIRVTREDSGAQPYSLVHYYISRKKYSLRLFMGEERRYTHLARQRMRENAVAVRDAMDQYVAVSSLSVYRLRSDDEYEVRDRHGSRIISPVDYRLNQARQGLTHFLLELGIEAGQVSAQLQKDVLASVLFSEEDREPEWKFDFDPEREIRNLNSAFKQLSAWDNDVRKKIRVHVEAINEMFNSVKSKSSAQESKSGFSVDFKPLEALRKTREIIELSLKAKSKVERIYSQRDLFIRILQDFVPDKDFSFSGGEFVVSNKYENIEFTKLSSGEKQLIILLVEALLQKQRPHVFLADEPELSLHIAWQRKIVPAIREINPKAQVIVATHSPEVASKYKDSIKGMDQIIND